MVEIATRVKKDSLRHPLYLDIFNYEALLKQVSMNSVNESILYLKVNRHGFFKEARSLVVTLVSDGVARLASSP